ncbi:MAG TPA: hypothetical protein VFX59_30360 [Polyangiales bacterium]|nr:hypothetical protein [Polyangiales bacterium]
MTAFLRRCLQTLLMVSLCACDEGVDSTVVRFYVYSDLPLVGANVTVLGADAGVSRSIPVNASIPSGDLLFWIAVRRTPESTQRERTLVSFEGYPEHLGKSEIVLRQTVSVPFTDKHTTYVRIRLSAACVHATLEAWCPSQTCDGSDGSCKPPPELAAAPFDAKLDLSRWEPSAQRLCTCAYGVCTGAGSCPATATEPSLEYVDDDNAIDFPAGFARRLVGKQPVAAVGVISDMAGEKFELFVAEDTGQMRPGTVLARGEATVKFSRGRLRAELPVSLGMTPSAQALWIGFRTDGGASVSFLQNADEIESSLFVGPIPAPGTPFEASALGAQEESEPVPSVYAVFYK